MIRWIVGTSLRFRFIVVALGLGLTFFGAQRLKDIPVDVFPEFAPPWVEVQTLCLGLSPAEVEEQVTVPIENAMNGVPGVEILRSSSVPQLSSVSAILARGADELAARQLVTERVAIATRNMPTWAAPPVMMPPVSTTSRVMKIGVTSKDLSMMDLSMLAYWKIRSRLLGVPGVANVPIWGEQLKMLQVQVDPERAGEARPDPRPCHGNNVGRAGGGAAALFRRGPYRYRRFHRYTRQALRRPPYPVQHDSGNARSGSRRET